MLPAGPLPAEELGQGADRRLAALAGAQRGAEGGRLEAGRVRVQWCGVCREGCGGGQHHPGAPPAVPRMPHHSTLYTPCTYTHTHTRRLLRISPAIPFTLINYALGSSSLPVRLMLNVLARSWATVATATAEGPPTHTHTRARALTLPPARCHDACQQFSHYFVPSVLGILPSLLIYIWLGSLAADVTEAVAGGGMAAPPAGEARGAMLCRAVLWSAVAWQAPSGLMTLLLPLPACSQGCRHRGVCRVGRRCRHPVGGLHQARD